MELASLLPIVAIGLVFWLLLIRPASKRQKAQQQLQSSLSVGDRVMLSSGVLGTLVGFNEEDDRAYLSIADGVVIEVVRGAVARVVQPAAQAEGAGPEEPTPGEA